MFLYFCAFFSLFGQGLRFEIYVLVYFYSFLVSCVLYNYYVLAFGFLYCECCGSLPHNEDIVRFRCGGGVTLPAKCFWGDFVLFWSTLIPFTLAISLYMSVSAR